MLWVGSGGGVQITEGTEKVYGGKRGWEKKVQRRRNEAKKGGGPSIEGPGGWGSNHLKKTDLDRKKTKKRRRRSGGGLRRK